MNIRSSLRCLLVVGLVSVWPATIVATYANDGSTDQRFLAGLRRRGLFELAGRYCRDRLDRADLPRRRRAELVIELSRTLAEQAVNSAPEERPPLWEQARQVTDQFVRQYPGDPRLLLVRFQDALGVLARGELARQEAQLVADNRQLTETARTHLRAAIQELRKLADDVSEQLRERSRPGGPKTVRDQPDQLAAYELASLEKNLQYQLARALRNQGECYGSDSPDRANSLNQAVEILDPLSKLDSIDPLAWKSRIDQVICYRLLADYPTARQKLEALLQQKPPPAIALRARAEKIRLALATGQLPEAIAILSSGRQIDGITSADLDYAWLETYLAAWRAASADDAQQATQWQTKATEMVRLIERRHGLYWTRRAEMLLAGYVRGSPDRGDLAMLIRAAESSFRSGRPDDALAAYDRARGLAEKNGEADRAFQLGYVAATIEHHRNRHQQALARYRQSALAAPNNPKAPEAHLLAIHHAAQLARKQSSGHLDQYTALLQEHLQTWPDTPSANKVRWRLGRLRQHLGDWQNAIAAYRAVSPNDPEYVRAVEAAGECYRAWLDQRKAAGQPTEKIAAEAAGWFESLVLGPEGRLPERWSPLARQAALTAARLRLDYTPSGYAPAERLLAAALQGATDAPPDWTSAARALLVFSLAGQGRRGEAAEVLKSISAGPPEQLLDMLEGLQRVAAAARPEVRAELAALQLHALELLRPHQDRLSPAAGQSLGRIQAQALADAGRSDEALRQYEVLAKASPRDPQIQEAYAQLLSGRTDRTSLGVALARWRELEKKSAPGSARWFRAKYAVASLHYRLGDHQQAARIITLLEVLHPEMGGPKMKAQLLGLLDRCRAAEKR